ncbi:MAG TPA: hypothetical protein VH107_09745, partial [Lacipirellulaceae bacterium]|nr:hypothetical protein [Lacipirellulaceae bacterium]
MNDQFSNDDMLFDRLVDGELTSNERRSLLESLDEQPDGWRRCALAFLEAQSWRSGLHDFTAAKSAASSPTPRVSRNPVAPTADSKRRSVWAAAEVFAVAAALLLAFKLGGWQRSSGVPIAANQTSAPSNQLATAPPAASPMVARPAKPGDAINLWVRDDGGQMKKVRVPLVDANALDHEYGTIFQTGVPDEVRSRLKDEGYAVQSKRQYAPMWLDNGRPMVVPVEDTKIVPV